MSEKDKNKNVENEVKVELKEEVKPFKYGVSPFLTIVMVRDKRGYRFEMPIGAHLDECKEACAECLVVIQKMRDDADAKTKEADEKAKKEADKKSKKEVSEEEKK